MSDHGLGTKVASRVLIEIQEIVAPHLHEGAAVLGSVSRVNGNHFSGVVVSERFAVVGVREISCKGNLKVHYLSVVRGWTALTLQAISCPVSVFALK